MKRKIFIISLIIVILGSILTVVFIFKNSFDKDVVPLQSNLTTQSENILNTPAPTLISTPSPEPTAAPEETDVGEILLQKNLDLDGDNIDEEITIMKVLDLNQQYEGVLKIKGKEKTIRIPFIKRAEDNPLGVFNSIEYVDLDGDSNKDIFITIPDTGNEFTTSYFFAYNYKAQKSFSYNIDNMDFVEGLINGFKFNYIGNGILNVNNSSINLTAAINVTNNSFFSDSEDINKAQYNKAWIENPPVEVDQNFKLILYNNKSQFEVKISLPIFGQSESDLLGEVDSYFYFNKEFRPVLKKIEVLEFNGNIKNIVISKDSN